MSTLRLSLLLALNVPLAAQDWQAQVGGTAPQARHSHALAFDSARGRLVLFGGNPFPGMLGDHWEWDGATWTRRFLSPLPAARSHAACAYDATRGRVVLFGGATALTGPGTWGNDTWEFDGSAWALRTPAHVPPGRNTPACAFDPMRGKVVLFGGYAPGQTLRDTWEWDGSDWTQVVQTSGPTVAEGAFGFDGIGLLWFGGWMGGGFPVRETWRLVGAGWTQLAPAHAPSERASAPLCWDARRGVAILFGGQYWDPIKSNYFPLGDTWEWNGSDWAERTVAGAPPAPRAAHRLAWDDARKVVLMFGGLGLAFGSTPLADLHSYASLGAVAPATALASEGNSALAAPFGTYRARMQTALASTSLAPGRGGFVRALEMRRDAGMQPFAGRTAYTRVLLGASVPLDGLATTFAANWSGAPQVCFDGPLALPALPAAGPGPAPFAVAIPFAAGFAHDGGDLLVELDVASDAGVGAYDLDAVRVDDPRGASARFGRGCSFVGPAPDAHAPEPLRLVVGGAVECALSGALPGTVALSVLGASTTSSGGLPLPFTLPGTACTVYTDWLASAYAFTDAAGAAAVRWPIPDLPQVVGATVYGQWAAQEGGGVFGLSNAYSATIAAKSAVPFDTLLNLDGGPVGTRLVGARIAPVLRLTP